ncbi:hypothetical protein WMY93_006236 [Mugilogobius chulae]|uniref:Uncharacterized protein n=1 Tax=Mugilogobius chulae TaxID=88201 RepID=A0AAW0PLW9_9GOBI
MKFFRKNAILVKELRGQLCTAEDANLALQYELQKEREDRAASEKALREALQKATNTSQLREVEMAKTTASLQKELEQCRQESQNALSKKEKDLQELQENLLDVKEEKAMVLQCIQDMIGGLMINHNQQVSKLQREKEEASKTSKNLQKNSNDRIRTWRTKASLVEKTQEIGTVLNQVELVQEELKNEQEKNRALQEQIQALTTSLEEKDQNVCSLETRISQYQTEKKKIAVDFQAVTKAVANMEDQMNSLLQMLNLKEEEKKQLENNLSSAMAKIEEQNQGHLENMQAMKELCERSVKEAQMLAEMNKEMNQTLRKL